MENEATGTFDVKLAPIGSGDGLIGSMAIDKIFHGGLQDTSVGQMLAFRSGVEGSAGYVAMERMTASLDGREGSFTLQHSGLMDKGAPSLTVVVVPDSATEGLTGLAATMNIVVTLGAARLSVPLYTAGLSDHCGHIGEPRDRVYVPRCSVLLAGYAKPGVRHSVRVEDEQLALSQAHLFVLDPGHAVEQIGWKRSIHKQHHDTVARCVHEWVAGERVGDFGSGSHDHADALAGICV